MRPTFDCPTFPFLFTVAAILIVLLFMAPAARAVDYEWDGDADEDRWDAIKVDGALMTNWDPDNFPTSDDNIILTAASAAGPVTIDVNGSREVGRIDLNGASGNYTFGETVGADTITLFQVGASVLVNQTQGSDLTFNSNIELNQGGGSVLRFNSTNAADNSGHIVVNGNVSPSAAATGAIELSLTSTNKSPGPWVTVNGVISDGPGATIGLTAGVEKSQSTAVIADHSGEVSVTGLNTFTGPVVVSGGKLIFNSIQNAGSTVPNALGTPSLAVSRITLGESAVSTATLRYVGSNTASNTSDRDIIIPGFSVTGTIEASGAVPLNLNGNIQTTASTTTRTLNLAGSNTGNNTFGGEIEPGSGSGVLNVNKIGTGKWILSGNSSNLDGSTTVNAGELVVTGTIGNNFTFPFPAGPLTIGSAGTLTIDGGAIYVGGFNNSSGGTFNFKSGLLTIGGNTSPGGAGSMIIGTDGVGTLVCYFGNQTYGDVTLNDSNDAVSLQLTGTYTFDNLDNSAGGSVIASHSTSILRINTGGTFTNRFDAGEFDSFFRASIQGGGSFTKQGDGTLVFDGTNAHTYTGNTRIEGGTLRVTTSDLPTVPTFVATEATLDLENATAGDEVGALTGGGTVINTASATFAVNFSGADATFSGSINGPGHFAKRGSGKQILTGPSNISGMVSVDAGGGILEIGPGGSITGASDVQYSTNAVLSVAGGMIDTPGDIRNLSNSAVLNISSGLVKANHIDRTVNTQYLSTFNWTGGTVHLLTSTTINGSTATAIDRPFAGSLTLDDDMALIIDGTFSVTGGGTFNVNGGSVTADTIVTGGNINFNAGTMRLRDNQAFNAARLAGLDIVAPLGATRSLIVDGMATITAPLTLAGGSFSAGQIINPQNLILGSGTLNITNSDLAISAATAVDATSGTTINVSSGGLNNAGELNLIGGEANLATASTNQAGAEINAINATLTFTGGLTNNGDVNLINSTVNGNLVNGAGSNSSLLGSNSFSDDLVLAGGDTLLIDIAGDQPGEFDVVTVGGNATLDGLLAVSLTGGFTPTVGQQFTVLTAGNVTDNGLVLGGAAASQFNMLIDSTSVVLQAIAAGLAGDYNQDGTVDAADYVVWRKNNGTPDGYNTWRANFGATLGSGSGSVLGSSTNASVPEPASALLLIFAAGFATWRGRRVASREKESFR